MFPGSPADRNKHAYCNESSFKAMKMVCSKVLLESGDGCSVLMHGDGSAWEANNCSAHAPVPGR